MNPFARIFLDDTHPIHERYQMLANCLDIEKPVLKTDLWNELKTGWPIKADMYVEIDQEMDDRAKRKGYNAIRGNIEKLPVANQSISSLLDFSTIHHIPDAFPALKAYFRALQNDGLSCCLLICWVGNKASHPMENWHGLQYYFNEPLLITKIIRAGFRIRWREKFEGLGDQASALKCFFLEKPKDSAQFTKKIRHPFQQLFPGLTKPVTPESMLKTEYVDVISCEKIAQSRMVNIHPEAQPVSGKFCFVATTEDSQIILRELNLPKESFLLEIEMESPAETFLQVFYLQYIEMDFTEDFSVRKRIFPGYNRVRAFIPESRAAGSMRIDPGNVPGKYCFLKVEIQLIKNGLK
jgi:SAM-dependent methyltransferase